MYSLAFLEKNKQTNKQKCSFMEHYFSNNGVICCNWHGLKHISQLINVTWKKQNIHQHFTKHRLNNNGLFVCLFVFNFLLKFISHNMYTKISIFFFIVKWSRIFYKGLRCLYLINHILSYQLKLAYIFSMNAAVSCRPPCV
jgi:hypothetical protein